MVEVKLVFPKSLPAVQENKLHRYVRSFAFNYFLQEQEDSVNKSY